MAPQPDAGPGTSRRAYAQLAVLGALLPVEAAVAAEWSLPVGSILIGGTVAAALTGELIPKALPRIRRTHSSQATPTQAGQTRIRLSVRRLTEADLLEAEAAIKRVCRADDSVAATAAGGFSIAVPGCTENEAELAGARIALAVENRVGKPVTYSVVSPVRPVAVPTPEAARVEDSSDDVDPHAIRRQIFHGEPGRRGIGALLLRHARAHLPLNSPVAI